MPDQRLMCCEPSPGRVVAWLPQDECTIHTTIEVHHATLGIVAQYRLYERIPPSDVVERA
jgi:hypothetical protein